MNKGVVFFCFFVTLGKRQRLLSYTKKGEKEESKKEKGKKVCGVWCVVCGHFQIVNIKLDKQRLDLPNIGKNTTFSRIDNQVKLELLQKSGVASFHH